MNDETKSEEIKVNVSDKITAVLNKLGIEEPDKYVENIIAVMINRKEDFSNSKKLENRIKLVAVEDYVNKYVRKYIKSKEDERKEQPDYNEKIESLKTFKKQYNSKSVGNSVTVLKDATIKYSGDLNGYNDLIAQQPNCVILGDISHPHMFSKPVTHYPKDMLPPNIENVRKNAGKVADKFDNKDVKDGVSITVDGKGVTYKEETKPTNKEVVAGKNIDDTSVNNGQKVNATSDVTTQNQKTESSKYNVNDDIQIEADQISETFKNMVTSVINDSNAYGKIKVNIEGMFMKAKEAGIITQEELNQVLSKINKRERENNNPTNKKTVDEHLIAERPEEHRLM